MELVNAARAIIHQRDHLAEHGDFDQTTFRPDADQAFDDWAADILETALAALTLPADHPGNADAKTVFAQDENGADFNFPIAWTAPADPALVEKAIAAQVGDLDGRSEWRLFRLQNGDLVIGFYPCGDTYLSFEADPNWL